MRLKIGALAVALALAWGAFVVLVGLAHLVWLAYGSAFRERLISIYPGVGSRRRPPRTEATALSHTAAVLLVNVMLLAGACSGRGEAGQSDTATPGAGPPPMGGMMGGHMPMMGSRATADTGATPRTTATATAAVGACPATRQALVDQGRLIFGGAGNCFACHGSSATGTPLAPDLTDTRWLNIDGSYAAIIPLVRGGVPHPKQYPAPMPPMGGAQLSDDQVCAVAAYVYSLHRP